MITQDELKDTVHYEPDTGYFGVIYRSTSILVPQIKITNEGFQKCLRINGQVYAVRDLIWLYMTGEWSTQCIYPVGNDPDETRWDWLTVDKSEAYRVYILDINPHSDIAPGDLDSVITARRISMTASDLKWFLSERGI